jgi:Tetratricopeptide repeat
MTNRLSPRRQRRLKDTYIGTFAPFIALVVFDIFLLYLLERIIFQSGLISRSFYLVLLLANPLVAIVLAGATQWAINRAGDAFHAMLASGGDPHTPTYSEIESLVTRERFVEAADCYRDVIADAPGDVEARIRLARILEMHLGDTAGAEQALLDARSHQPSPGQATVIANELIDLYRKSGNRERLRGELSRFAREHPGSAAGRHALAEFKRLAAEQQKES